MAIQTQRDQNLVETLVIDKKIPTTTTDPKPVVNTAKTSFLKSVIVEMSKVKYPTLKYVLTWSVLVIAFTGAFSLVLGGADHIFEGGINFVSCSSPKGKNRGLATCSTDLAKQLFFVSPK